MVERALRAHQDERLTLSEAVDVSGYSRGHLMRLVRDGKLHLADDQTLLRRDLPSKPKAQVARPTSTAPFSRSQLARAVAENRDG